jgi:hypothetical protein
LPHFFPSSVTWWFSPSAQQYLPPHSSFHIAPDLRPTPYSVTSFTQPIILHTDDLSIITFPASQSPFRPTLCTYIFHRTTNPGILQSKPSNGPQYP